jgi:uncharacterized membrane protein YfcA
VEAEAAFTLEQVARVWYIFPVAVLFSTVALSTGISGALFFSPFFLMVVGLAPAQAIGAGLMTELAGTSFATANYLRQRVVDFKTARMLLLAAVPAIVAGSFISHLIDPGMLRVVFGGILFALAVVMLVVTRPHWAAPSPRFVQLNRPITRLVDSAGGVHEFRVCYRPIDMVLAGIGGLLTGLMSAGLPEITTTQLVVRCHVPPRIAVATSIFVLAVSVLAGTATHALQAQPAWHVVALSVPGVVVGAQIGPRIGHHLPARAMERVLAGLFAVVGLIVIAVQIIG